MVHAVPKYLTSYLCRSCTSIPDRPYHHRVERTHCSAAAHREKKLVCFKCLRTWCYIGVQEGQPSPVPSHHPGTAWRWWWHLLTRCFVSPGHLDCVKGVEEKGRCVTGVGADGKEHIKCPVSCFGSWVPSKGLEDGVSLLPSDRKQAAQCSPVLWGTSSVWAGAWCTSCNGSLSAGRRGAAQALLPRWKIALSKPKEFPICLAVCIFELILLSSFKCSPWIKYTADCGRTAVYFVPLPYNVVFQLCLLKDPLIAKKHKQ